MPKLANTFVTVDASGNREELHDVVSRITPEDTPIYSLIEKESGDSVHPEWEYDELAAPGPNVHPEGNEYAFDATDPAIRVGNYTQILTKTGVISNTQDSVDNAGNNEKTKEAKLKRSIEIRKDTEFSIVANNASVGGETRESGGLPTWIETNVNREGTGANGGFDSGSGLTVAATDGAKRAFAKPLLDDVMQQCYDSGGNARHMVCSSYNKGVFATFMSDTNVAQFRYAASSSNQNTIVGTADVYLGPHGEVMVHANRVMATEQTARNVFLLDADLACWKWLRRIKSDPNIAKTGDAKKFAIVGEGALKVKNEAAHGVIADVFGVNATT